MQLSNSTTKLFIKAGAAAHSILHSQPDCVASSLEAVQPSWQLPCHWMLPTWLTCGAHTFLREVTGSGSDICTPQNAALQCDMPLREWSHSGTAFPNGEQQQLLLLLSLSALLIWRSLVVAYWPAALSAMLQTIYLSANQTELRAAAYSAPFPDMAHTLLHPLRY